MITERRLFGRRPGLLVASSLALVVVGVVASFVFVGGLFGSSDDDDGRPYVEAVAGTVQRINPLFAYLNDTDRDVVSLVFSGLTRLGPDGEVLPDLAESWSYSEDGLTVTFELRPGVKWHSGVAFTADDVIFTYNLLADPALQGDPEQAPLWRTATCRAPNDLRVTCRLPEPFAPFLAYTTIGVLPEHLLKGVDTASMIDHRFNDIPVGTGPYRMQSQSPTEAVLTAYEGYHLGTPQLPEIVMRFFPDIGSAAAAVVSGAADGILMDASATSDEYEAVSGEDRLQAYAQSRAAYSMLYLNNSEPPMTDANVRLAIALAVDAGAIISDLLGGRGLRADVPIAPGTWAFDPDQEPLARDIGQARTLLEEAGWELPEGEDIRQRGGTELRISIMTDRDALRGAVADAIAAQLAEAGIAATVIREDSTALIRDFLLPRRYEAAVFGWEPGPDPDPYPAWHTSQATGDGRNLAAYSNPAADAVMEQARVSNDLAERQRLYHTFQELFDKHTPSVLLYYPVSTYFVTDEVKNIATGVMFDTSSRFRNAYEWTFEETPDIRRD